MNIAPLVSSSDTIDTLCQQVACIKLTHNQTTNPYSKQILVIEQPLTQLPSLQFWQVLKRALQLNPFAHLASIESQGSFARSVIDVICEHDSSLDPNTLGKFVSQIERIGIPFQAFNDMAFTPLHHAAIFSKEELVVKNSQECPKNTCDKHGRTPLHLCALLGRTKVAQALLENGADADFCTPLWGSPMALAHIAKQTDLIELLAKHLPNRPPPTTHFSLFQNQALACNIISASSQDHAITEIATAIFRLKFQRDKDFKATFAKVAGISPNRDLVCKYYKDEKIRRIFYHSWKIDWSISDDYRQVLYSKENPALSFLPVSGGFAETVLRKMAKATHAFCQTYEKDLSLALPCFSLLEETLFFAAEQRQTPVTVIFERYRARKPLLLIIRFTGHVLLALIWGNYFFLCNRGAGHRKSIEVFRFSPKLLNESILARLTKTFETEADYKQYMFTDLPALLQFQKKPFEKHLEEMLKLSSQTIGNCSWDNSEAAAYVFLLIQALKEHDLLHYQTFSDFLATTLALQRQRAFNNWLLFQQLGHLEKYLQLLHSPETSFISNHSMLYQVVESIEQLQQAKWVDKSLIAKINSLKLNYPILNITKPLN